MPDGQSNVGSHELTGQAQSNGWPKGGSVARCSVLKAYLVIEVVVGDPVFVDVVDDLCCQAYKAVKAMVETQKPNTNLCGQIQSAALRERGCDPDKARGQTNGSSRGPLDRAVPARIRDVRHPDLSSCGETVVTVPQEDAVLVKRVPTRRRSDQQMTCPVFPTDVGSLTHQAEVGSERKGSLNNAAQDGVWP